VNWSDILAVGLIVLLMPMWWAAICLLIARCGPWHKLAVRYPESHMLVDADHYRFVSMRCGLSSYGGCLHARATEDYLTLAPMLLFRFGHPPIAIPRCEVRDVERQRNLLGQSVSFQVGDFHITLSGRVVDSRFFRTRAG
jgi:hypothetical protein